MQASTTTTCNERATDSADVVDRRSWTVEGDTILGRVDLCGKIYMADRMYTVHGAVYVAWCGVGPEVGQRASAVSVTTVRSFA